MVNSMVSLVGVCYTLNWLELRKGLSGTVRLFFPLFLAIISLEEIASWWQVVYKCYRRRLFRVILQDTHMHTYIYVRSHLNGSQIYV